MKIEKTPTGMRDVHLTRKYLLLFPAISTFITLTIILLFLALPIITSTYSFVGKVLGVETQGGSAIELSRVLDENFNLSLAGHLEGSVIKSTTNTSPPLVVLSDDLVEKLNTDLLDGHHGAYYLDASNFKSGTINISLLPDLSSLYLPIEGTSLNSLKLGGEEQSFYLNASNLDSGTMALARLPDLSSLYLSLSGGALSGTLSLSDNSIDSLGSITFSDGTIQTTAQATAATFVVCASDSNNLGRCDYVADGAGDQVEIQEAIDDLPAAGGKIVLLEGNYYISTSIILRSNLEISGSGGTKLELTIRDNFFRWDDGYVDPNSSVDKLHDIYIHDMELDGNKAAFSSPSAYDADKGVASAIKIFSSSRIHIANLYIHDMEASYAILLKGRVYPGFDAGSTDVFVQKNIFRNIGDAALNNGAVYSDHDNTIIQSNLVDTINGNGLDIDVAQEGMIIDNIIKNVTSTGGQGYSIVTGYNAKNITIAGNTITGASRGIANHIGGTPANDNHVIINNILQDSPGAIDYAIKLQDSGHVVSGNRIRNWNHDAINLVATKNSVISGNVISEITRGFGIGINLTAGVDDLIIEDNIISDTGTVAQKGWGMRLLPFTPIYDIIIRGNRIFDSGAGVQGTGILLNTVPTTSEIQIEGNYLEENPTPIGFVGGSALSSTVKALRNRGFTTENSGLATVASGTTFIAVSHGLSTTPTASDIQVTPTNSLGSATKFWISSVGSSTFRINVDANPGVTTATFSWSAAIY